MYLQLYFAKENSHHNPLIVTTHLKILRTFKKFNKFSELSFQTVESFQMMHINLKYSHRLLPLSLLSCRSKFSLCLLIE